MRLNEVKGDTDLLTIPEFAAIVRLTIAGIRRWVLLQRVTTVRIGRRVLIPRSEAERLIQAGFRPARPQRAQ